MNKKEQMKKLTKKFFIEQKVKEIIKFFLWGVFGISLIFLIASLGRFLDVLIKPLIGGRLIFTNMNLWYEFLGYVFFGFFILFLILFPLSILIKFLIDWIESNWKLAEERARREI